MTDKTLPQYEHEGRSLTIPEWATVTGIRSYDISMRLRQGWTLARIIAEVKPTSAPQVVTQPVEQPWEERLFTHEGETLELPAWSVKSGIPLPLLTKRLSSGWGLQRALTYPASGAPKVLDPGTVFRARRTITFNGETLTPWQWAQRAGITLSTLNWRLARWDDLGRVLTESKNLKGTRRVGGKTLTLKEAAREAGLNYGTLMTRLRSGWTLADALRVPAGSIMGNNAHRHGTGTVPVRPGGGSATSKTRRGPAGDHQRESAPKQGFS